VLLSLLLKEAGVQKGASWIVAASADTAGHASSIPLEKAMDDALAVYGQNGETLHLENGYPLRLICPGYGGRIHVKWLNRIKVVDQPYMTTQDRSHHMEHTPAMEGSFLIAGELAHRFQFEMYAKSVITFPSGEHKLPGHGFYEITGLAWSGGGKVRRVEVSTDGGRTWKDAELQEPVFSRAHTRFRLPWNWNGEEAVLQSRCTDENGDVQPTLAEESKLWGADPSEACTSVMGDACNRIPRRANRSYIQSWRVARDGTVHNAFAEGASETASNSAPGEHH
jgi:sulfane dehydrogenase subunit SoxC